MKHASLLTLTLSLGTAASTASAATLTQGDWLFLSYDTNTVDLSVYDGKAGYSGAGEKNESSPVSGTFGDGTVSAYRFFNENPNDEVGTYAQGGGLISDLSTTDTSLTGSSFVNLWTTSDPDSDPADHTSSTVLYDIGTYSGSIDISELTSGTIYLIYGAYRSTPSFDLTMSDTDGSETDILLESVGDDDFANNNEWYLLSIDFVNDAGYDKIDFVSDNNNNRFIGVVVDGVVPEPGSLALLGLGGLLIGARRRRG